MSFPINFRNLAGSVEAAGDFEIFRSATDPTPNYTFHQGETIYFDFNWTQSGLMFDPAYGILWGPWQLRLYLERIGPDMADPVPVVPDVSYVAGSPRAYDPPRFGLSTTGYAPGTFRVTATVCLQISGSHFPFAGFIEGPIIQIHSR
jgi:hypothetical protein